MATPVWLPVLEEAVNRFLALDPSVRQRLERLSGRVLAVEVAGLPGPIYLSFPGGSVHLADECSGVPDAALRGGPLALARLALAADGERLLLDGEVQVEGEPGVLREVRSCLAGFTVDWEEQLAKRLGDVPAHALGNQGRAIGGWLAASRESLGLDLRDYLWEEARLLPRPEAVADLLGAIDTLRDDVERLAQRVERLARRLGEGPVE